MVVSQKNSLRLAQLACWMLALVLVTTGVNAETTATPKAWTQRTDRVDPLKARWEQMQTAARARAKSNGNDKRALIDSMAKVLSQQGQPVTGATEAANSPNDYLGWQVAMTPTTAAVVATKFGTVSPDPQTAQIYVFDKVNGFWQYRTNFQPAGLNIADKFGFSIAISNNTIAIGAPGEASTLGPESGSVYVFVRSGNNWNQQAKLRLNNGDGPEFVQYGNSVALSGDTLVVGAPFDRDSGDEFGAAYVYTRSGSVWSQQQRLTSTAREGGDQFGYSVAVDGNTAAIGALKGGSTDTGNAVVFTRNVSTWTQQQLITATGATADDQFGLSIAVHADTLVVGAIEVEAGTLLAPIANAGAAYLFFRTGSTWVQQHKFQPANAATEDDIGWSVDVSGDSAIVGAPLAEVGALNEAGRAFVLKRTAGVWAQEGDLSANAAAAGDWFGSGVQIDGNDVLVGAPFDDTLAGTDAGTVRAFNRSGVTWTETATVAPGDNGAGDGFGVSVAISGTTAAVGAYLDDNARGTDAGSVYVFTLSNNVWTLQTQIIATDGAANDQFGVTVDLDGDTLLIGANNAEVGPNTDAGAAYVYTRTASVWTQQGPRLVASTPINNAHFGSSVALQGDRAVVGAPDDTADLTSAVADAGAVYVFERASGVWAMPTKLFAGDAAAQDSFGTAVALDGNTILVGAPGADLSFGPATVTDMGTAYAFVFDTAWSEQDKLIATISGSATAGDGIGQSVSLDGDVAILGAPMADVTSPSLIVNAGAVHVFDRVATDWTHTTRLLAPNPVTADVFGFSVSVLGSKLLVGAPGRTFGTPADTGSIMQFNFASSWAFTAPELKHSSAAVGDLFGASIDQSLNGMEEWALIGAPLDDDASIGSVDKGFAYFFLENGELFADGFEDPIAP